MALILVLISIVIFVIAYVTYGAWLAKEWGLDVTKTTPATDMEDGVDYVPAKAPVLMGHHFSSIAGAGPIVGPIAAAAFGWLPVYIWIIVGSIFFGGVHDFGSLFASVRNKGRSIGYIIEDSVGVTEKRLFNIFAWLTLLLVIAAFANIIVATFIAIPAVATTSLLFIIVAIGYGFLTQNTSAPLWLTTLLGVGALVGCIWLGNIFPIVASFNTWYFIVMVYIFIASIAPVWILLQPRDYLNSYLLYAMIGGAVIGLLMFRPSIETPAFTGFFNANGQALFPILFITVACGAISGFHSLVASGTSSKQVATERDIKMVGYGSMLIEGVLAVIALITAVYVSKDTFGELMVAGNANNVFATGIGNFMTSFGVPFAIGQSFVALSISAFALTSLDTATRIGRFIFSEFFTGMNEAESTNIFANKYVATTITVALGGGLGLIGWKNVWPIFGSANQLLAAIALLAVAVWLKHMGKNNKMIVYPMVFMFIVTIASLFLLAKGNLGSMMAGEIKGILLTVISTALLILAFVLVFRSYKHLVGYESKDKTKREGA